MKKNFLLLLIVWWATVTYAQDQQALSRFVQSQTLTIEAYGKKALETPGAQIIDVRSASEYAINHIKGAINIDLADSVKAQSLLAQLDPNKPTFTYSIREGRSVILAQRLKSAGFKEVYFMPGGIGAWVGAGFPLESTADASKSLDLEAYRQLVASHALTFVDISSIHCGSCKRLHPILDELEKAYPSIHILRLEMDENLQLVRDLKVKVLPTLLFYKSGELVWQHVGIQTKEQLQDQFETWSK